MLNLLIENLTGVTPETPNGQTEVYKEHVRWFMFTGLKIARNEGYRFDEKLIEWDSLFNDFINYLICKVNPETIAELIASNGVVNAKRKMFADYLQRSRVGSRRLWWLNSLAIQNNVNRSKNYSDALDKGIRAEFNNVNEPFDSPSVFMDVLIGELLEVDCDKTRSICLDIVRASMDIVKRDKYERVRISALPRAEIMESHTIGKREFYRCVRVLKELIINHSTLIDA